MKVRTHLIDSHLKALIAVFGKARVPVEEEELFQRYTLKDWAGMTASIKATLNLGIRLVLGLVNSGGPDAPAWTNVFAKSTDKSAVFSDDPIKVFLRKSFLAEYSFETVVLAIAHELSHLVLAQRAPALWLEEEAVDLAAMLLGFRDFYVTGNEQWMVPEGSARPSVHRFGYLTAEEIVYASHKMTYG